MIELWQFYKSHWNDLLVQVIEHLQLSIASVLLACLIAIPSGIFIYRHRFLSNGVLQFTGILQTIPSIALLGFMIPVLGIGFKPALVALFIYSLLPILRNTYLGLAEIDPAVRDSALAMGMTARQRLLKVELPLAFNSIIAGVRTATVINVGVATLAAYIAAGGLGEFIFGGIALNNTTMIIAGALPAALLAVLLDSLLGLLQKFSSSAKLKSALSVLVVGLGLSAAISWQSTSLKAAFPPEFVGRSDGLPKLEASYQLEIPHLVIAPALMYEALRNGEVSLISGYSTDGRIAAYNLRTLRDDHRAFPPYEAAILINNHILEQHPNLRSLLARLEGIISAEEMRAYNLRIDEGQAPPAAIAKEILKSKGLWAGASADIVKTQTLNIATKTFTEQYLLGHLLKLYLERHSPMRVELKKGLGGTKICFDALKEGEIDLYVEYSGTAFQVLLEQDYQSGYRKDLVFKLCQEGLNEQGLSYLFPLGFDNTYANMMRESEAKAKNISRISDLEDYLGK